MLSHASYSKHHACYLVLMIWCILKLFEMKDRRQFLELVGKGALVLGTFGSAILNQVGKKQGIEAKGAGLQKRQLGKTGFKATILALGGTILPKVSEKEAIATVKKCLELGINYFDTARQYGNGESERRLGLGLQGEDHDKIWVATKTLFRPYSQAKEEIAGSLKRLNLKKPLDCIQLHAITDMKTLDTVMSKEGSFQAALEAKKAGLVKHIGITSHSRPEVLVEALKRYPFATALVACGVADQYIGDFITRFVPFARKQGCGIIAMKVFAEGRLVGKLNLEKLLLYALNQPIDTAIIGMGKPEHVEENFRYAVGFKKLSRQQMQLIAISAKPYGNPEFLWWKRGVK